jgi:hypothetical protein
LCREPGAEVRAAYGSSYSPRRKPAVQRSGRRARQRGQPRLQAPIEEGATAPLQAPDGPRDRPDVHERPFAPRRTRRSRRV